MPDGRSPARRDRFLRRPQRPGCPQRLHALGTASAIYLVRSPVNLSARRELVPFACCRTTFTITGSATFTLAVMELSRISFLASMENRERAVRILWTMGLPCGKARKRRQEIPRASKSDPKQHRITASAIIRCSLSLALPNDRSFERRFHPQTIRASPLWRTLSRRRRFSPEASSLRGPWIRQGRSSPRNSCRHA